MLWWIWQNDLDEKRGKSSSCLFGMGIVFMVEVVSMRVYSEGILLSLSWRSWKQYFETKASCQDENCGRRTDYSLKIKKQRSHICSYWKILCSYLAIRMNYLLYISSSHRQDLQIFRRATLSSRYRLISAVTKVVARALDASFYRS